MLLVLLKMFANELLLLLSFGDHSAIRLYLGPGLFVFSSKNLLCLSTFVLF
jgi:hypothetical protein